jgi:hypothetical protein
MESTNSLDTEWKMCKGKTYSTVVTRIEERKKNGMIYSYRVWKRKTCGKGCFRRRGKALVI